jgi:rRNA processing protein Gar1
MSEGLIHYCIGRHEKVSTLYSDIYIRERERKRRERERKRREREGRKRSI